MEYHRRIEKLKLRLQQKNLDAIIINKQENIFYLCGFEAETSFLVITSSGCNYLITDNRFKEEAEDLKCNIIVKLIDGSLYAQFADIVKSNKIKRLGFESEHLSYSDFFRLSSRLKKIALIPTKDVVEGLRIIKDGEEIAFIKRAVSITKRAYLYGKNRITPNYNGVRFAALLDNRMRRYGATKSAFQTIVSQNPYSSRPHCPSTEIIFAKRSAVLVDLGAVFKGYNSDLTRVIFLDRISTKFRYIYNIIKTSQRLSIDKIKPGVKISEIDKTARNYIADKGLKDYFLHSLGHGVGLQVHEKPNISFKNKERLRTGMIFTIEPGIYIKGWGGLRLEDMVLVTEDGCEVLTDDIPK